MQTSYIIYAAIKMVNYDQWSLQQKLIFMEPANIENRSGGGGPLSNAMNLLNPLNYQIKLQSEDST